MALPHLYVLVFIPDLWMQNLFLSLTVEPINCSRCLEYVKVNIDSTDKGIIPIHIIFPNISDVTPWNTACPRFLFS